MNTRNDEDTVIRNTGSDENNRNAMENDAEDNTGNPSSVDGKDPLNGIGIERRARERRTKEKKMPVDGSTDDFIEKLKSEICGKDDEIQKLNREIDSIKDLIQRRQADFDNYKKRNQKQLEQNKKYAVKEFAVEIIAIDDDLLRAIESSASIKEGETLENSHDSFVHGVTLISKRIQDLLNKFGIVEIDAMGKPFDPNFHECVEIEMSGDFQSDTVTKVHQKGFTIDDMVIRTSKVKVTKPSKQEDEKVKGNSADE